MKRQLGLILLGALLAALILLGARLIRPDAVLPTGVQVAFIWGSVEMPPHKATQMDGLASHTFEAPVTIIGVEGFGELFLMNPLGTGSIEALTLVSTGPTWSSPGSFFEIGAIIAGNLVNINGISQIVSMGVPIVFDRMMFPAGQGIELDAGGTVYLNVLDINGMGNPQRGWHGARVYYVFR